MAASGPAATQTEPRPITPGEVLGQLPASATIDLTRAMGYFNTALADSYRGRPLYVEIPPWLRPDILSRAVSMFQAAGWRVHAYAATTMHEGRDLGPSVLFQHRDEPAPPSPPRARRAGA